MSDIPSLRKKLVKIVISSYYSATPSIHYVRTNITRVILTEVLHNSAFVGLSGRDAIRDWFVDKAARNKMKGFYAPHWLPIINDLTIEKLVDWDFISRVYEKTGFIDDILECNDSCTDCREVP
jgi:hypothetical protein